MEDWKEKEDREKLEHKVHQSEAASAAGDVRKVIFQIFVREKSRYSYPYPPVYREPDTDYICFTRDVDIHSNHWLIQQVESLEQEVLEFYLKEYDIRFELQQDHIQMGPLFQPGWAENLVTVPDIGELPFVKLDMSKFEPTVDEEGKFGYRKNPIYQKGKYDGRPLLLTIGVPVSNQIDTIDRCLSRIKPLLEKLDAELVVIDTGSTDGTVEVCESYGARVYSHPWHDNMSAVRNEAIYHARGLWYMSIDDDEWFEDVEDILHFFQKGFYRKYSYATYIQRNYLDIEGKIYEDHQTPRMAKITPELHFEGRIHDALVVDLKGGRRQLKSYAHHYGFVHDKQEKVQAKFIRNATILLQDVYEYPENLRYLFQLANEYKVIGSREAAVRLFAQCLALSKKEGLIYRGRISVVELLACLYDMKDERLFAWTEYMTDLFPLIVAERGFVAWCMCSLAFGLRKPAQKVLAYYDRYEKLLEEYREDTDPAKALTFYGVPMMEHDYYIMDVEAIGFCVCIKTGDEERALGLLEQFSLETVDNKRVAVLEEGFAAGDAVYGALCEKMTALQWEEWSETILNGIGADLTHIAVYERVKKRFPEILSRLSVQAIFSWLANSEIAGRKAVRKKLLAYALNCVEQGRSLDEATPLQELALCARVLKEAYVKNRAQGVEEKKLQNSEGSEQPKSQADVQEERTRLLKAYILAEGAFAERYYNPELLADAANTAIPPETQAIYLMANALADGRASSENVALLKQALAIFPPFHGEVRSILKELR